MPAWQRFTALATVVVAVHAAGLWALNAYKLPTSLDNQAPALQTRAIEPLQLPQLQQPLPPVSTSQTPLAPVNPKAAAAANTTAPLKPAVESTPAATAPLLAGKLPRVAPSAPQPPTGNYASASNAPTAASSAAPVAASAANSPAVAAGASVSTSEQVMQLPSIDADHIDTQYRHPKPAISERLGESGRVLVNVQVGLNGKPLQVLVVKSSGFERLDDNAIKTVMQWKFRPGIKNGVPEVMWVEQSVRYDPPKEN
jgi:periplasmic protein TonB